MMKKWIEKFACLLLTVAVGVGGLGINSYAADSETMSENMIFAIDTLRCFGLIPDYYDYNTDIAQYPSRADFASTAAKLINADKYNGQSVYFYDVPKTHWAYNEISELTSRGFLSGKGDKVFLPDEKITKQEASKILLDLMGYTQYCQAGGGYPEGYSKKASELKLYKGTSDDKYLTMGDMFMLVFNAMKTEIVDFTGVVGDFEKYEVSDTKTLLSVYHGTYYARGIVDGANFASVNETALQAGQVEIDGEVMDSDIDLPAEMRCRTATLCGRV